jgi:hypothetical protein
LLKITLDVSLQAASVLDGPAAAAGSGSLGRRNGTIAIDGMRSSAVTGPCDRFPAQGGAGASSIPANADNRS